MAHILPVYGDQDIYLTLNPEYSLFGNGGSKPELIYKRHTHFTYEDKTIYKSINDFGTEINIPFHDIDTNLLLASVSAIITLPETENFVDDIELALIETIILETHNCALHKLSNHNIYMYDKKYNTITKKDKNTFLITIPFFMNKYNDIHTNCIKLTNDLQLKLKFESLKNLVKYEQIIDTNAHFQCEIYCRFIHLDNEEKNKTAAVGKEHLISCNGSNIFNINKYKIIHSQKLMHFNHPTKTLDFAFKFPTTHIYFNYQSICTNMLINVNGIELVNKPKIYFIDKNNIYTYNFALEPKKFKPTGTLNLSVVNNMEVIVNIDKQYSHDIMMIVTSEYYNVLRRIENIYSIAYVS